MHCCVRLNLGVRLVLIRWLRLRGSLGIGFKREVDDSRGINRILRQALTIPEKRDCISKR